MKRPAFPVTLWGKLAVPSQSYQHVPFEGAQNNESRLKKV